MQAVQFSQPPPPIPNLLVPPPSSHFTHNRFHNSSDRGGHRGHFFQPFRPYPRPGPGGPDSEFDGKRLRKSVMRKTVDYNSAIIKMLECRVWQRDFRDRRALQPDVTYYPDLQPPPSYIDNAINSVTTRFVKTATNKMRCPIFCMAWTPEGRRLVTGASSGEFTLWNGLTFNFETILQAHDSPVRTMVWSHNDVWMVTGDHAGYVKYWQSNMNNVKMFQAHKEAIRGLSFSPTDHKFVTCSDDGTLRIWDFARCYEERILRGHGADVKCVHWHPQKGLIISGSKDNQQPVKLWDPKSGNSLATLHAHKSTVMDIKWNANGNWVVTASRDHLLKLFDLRNLSQEVQTFRGHKKEASSVAWHPYHEGLFCSGGSDGAILFWHVGILYFSEQNEKKGPENVGKEHFYSMEMDITFYKTPFGGKEMFYITSRRADKEVGGIEQAHDSIVWTLAWHPLGHILCSGSNDHTSKFWTRNRPGDLMRDKYNLNTLPAGLPGFEDQDVDDTSLIPGMGPEDKVETVSNPVVAQIPGLDFDGVDEKHRPYHKKVPYSKPIPRNFQAQWNETGKGNNEDGKDDDSDDDENSWRGRKALSLITDPITEVITQLIETNPPPGVIPLSQLQPQAIIMYGKLIPVEGNAALAEAIAAGPAALNRFINSGELEELSDVIPHVDDREDYDDYEDYDENTETENSQDVELPPPLPSSSFARNRANAQEPQQQQQQQPQQQPQQQSQQKQQQPRRSRFSDRDDLMSNMMDGNSSSSDRGFARGATVAEDKDMRSLPMQPGLRLNPGPDQDMRYSGLIGGGGGDLDLRQIPIGGPPPLLGGPSRIPTPLGDRSAPHGMGDQDFRRLEMDSDFRQLGEPMPHHHDEDLRNHQGFDQDLRGGMRDMDLRTNPAGMFPPPQEPQPLLGSHFDSDFRQLGRPHSESPHRQRAGPMPPRHEQFDPEEEREQEMSNKEDRNWQFGGPPRSLLEQEPWGMGPRKRRWGDLSADDEESNHMESGNRYNNFRPRPLMEDYYPMSPGGSENSPSNGRAFMDQEDNYSERGGDRRRQGPGPDYRLHEQKAWPNRPYPPGPEGLYPMEGNAGPGGFRNRGGGGRGRGRGALGGIERGRGGPRGRFGAQRGVRGGRGSKRGQF